jgi:hypothetical protein
MPRVLGLICVVAALPLGGLAAQELLPNQGETREAAPLFRSNDVLVATVEAPLKTALDDRGEGREFHQGRLIYLDPLNAEEGSLELDVEIRVRGNFRAQRKNCSFPPLRMDMGGDQLRHTVFEGQSRLRLVTHCRDQRNDRGQYVLQEYLAYRVFNLLSDLSVQVRLARITYVDTEGTRDPFTRYAFFLEDYNETAARSGWELLKLPQMPPDQIDQGRLATFEVFQFMIGNTDWSVAFASEGEDYCCHNAVMMGTMVGPVLPVPFDFDWAGVVDAPYATPDSRLNIRSVRQRKFWGICKPREVVEGAFPLFDEKREEIYELYRAQEGLDERQIQKSLEYYDEFYTIIFDERRAKREIFDECRQLQRREE